MPKRVDRECGCALHHAEWFFSLALHYAPRGAPKEVIYRSSGGSTDLIGSVAGALPGVAGDIGSPSCVCTQR